MSIRETAWIGLEPAQLSRLSQSGVAGSAP